MKKILLTSILCTLGTLSFANNNMVDLVIAAEAPADHTMVVQYQLAYKNAMDNIPTVDANINSAQVNNGNALVVVPKTFNNRAYEYAGIVIKSAFLLNDHGDKVVHVHLDEKFGDQESCSSAVKTSDMNNEGYRQLNLDFAINNGEISLNCSKENGAIFKR